MYIDLNGNNHFTVIIIKIIHNPILVEWCPTKSPPRIKWCNGFSLDARIEYSYQMFIDDFIIYEYLKLHIKSVFNTTCHWKPYFTIMT